jgi:hypothetical protein
MSTLPRNSAPELKPEGAYRKESVAQQLLGDPVGRLGPGIADGHICIAGMEVENSIRADHLERRIGVQCPPQGEARDQPPARECIRCGNAQWLAAGVSPDGCKDSGEGFEPVADHRKKPRSVLSKNQGTGRRRNRAQPQ